MFKFRLGIILFICSFVVNAQKKSPNILIIQVDDMGYDDLSVNGNKVSHTPHLDSFSKQSVRFDNFMVNSVCAPTRSSLLTGRDFWKTGVSGVHGGKDFLNLNETTFADVFQKNGYKTGMWGKWHSGKADGYWPWDRGFDEAYYAKLYKYFPSEGYYNEFPKKIVHKGKWSPKVIVDYAVDFVSKNKEKPFLAYVSFLSVHAGWKAPESYKKKYRKEGRTEKFATLLGMLSFMDDEVGRLLDHITKLGLDDNTVVLFLSDNGPIKSGESQSEWTLRNNHGYLGNKARLWQNGIKSPLYVRWKGNYKPSNVKRLVSVTDIFPTILDIANLKTPKNNLPLDGRSVVPYLKGDTESLSEKTAIFSHWHPYTIHKSEFKKEMQTFPMTKQQIKDLEFDKQKITIMDEHYKYFFNAYDVKEGPELKYTGGDLKTKTGLIDLVNDPMETKNIIDEQPEIAAKYRDKIQKWFHKIKETKDVFNSPEFQIGWKGKKESSICGFGSSFTYGVSNENHYLQGFDKIGDHVLYDVNVHEKGTYKVTIERKYAKKLNKGVVLKISSGKNSVEGEVDANSFSTIGEIKLKKGVQSLKVEIVESKGGTTVLGVLKSIKLVRI